MGTLEDVATSRFQGESEASNSSAGQGEKTSEDRTKDVRRAIGERLRWVIIDRFGTMHNASRELDNQIRTMQRWLSGETMPSVEYLLQFHEIGISVTWILTGKGCAYLDSCDVTACCQMSDACMKREGRPVIHAEVM